MRLSPRVLLWTATAVLLVGISAVAVGAPEEPQPLAVAGGDPDTQLHVPDEHLDDHGVPLDDVAATDDDADTAAATTTTASSGGRRSTRNPTSAVPGAPRTPSPGPGATGVPGPGGTGVPGGIGTGGIGTGGIGTGGATTPTTAPGPPAFEVARRHGYWVGDPDVPTASWLVRVENSGDSWSPDGTEFVYRSSWVSISIIDVRTRAIRTLIEDPDRSLSDPTWSPDGRHVAVHETQYDKPPVLLILDLQGNEVARYTDWVDGSDGFAWSPDGSQIAWGSYDHRTDDAWLSYATLGQAPVRIAHASGAHRFIGLVWSPRGNYLGWNFDEDLHLLRLSTRQERTFPLDGLPIYGHAWDPDESHLVVWSNHLMRMRPDGTEVQEIDPYGANASIDPETGRIAWARSWGPDVGHVLMSEGDGSRVRTVFRPAPGGGMDGVQWSPAGGKLLFIEYG